MYRIVAKRVLSVIPVMVIVAAVVFLILRLSPGDPAVVIAGDTASAETIEQIRSALGLDRPILEQFWIWIINLASGDLGTSIFSKLPVTDLILQRVEPTVSLALTTIVFAVVVAVPLGTLAGANAGSRFDRFIMTASVVGFSVPAFVLAYCLVYVFSLQLGWFPVQGFTSITQGFVPFVRSITLPTVTLGLVFVVLIARITRASVLEALAEDHIKTARAKGIAESLVVLRHALRNAAIPILTVIGIGVALLVGGVVIVETVFNIPGIGRLVVDAVLKRDYPVIQGVILVLSGVYVAVNLVLDIAYIMLDPRIRY